jgi:hypothetical protein
MDLMTANTMEDWPTCQAALVETAAKDVVCCQHGRGPAETEDILAITP